MANRFWVGGTNNWNNMAGSKWAATSGGASGESAPTLSDDVFFDGNSGSGTVTVTIPVNLKSVDFTGFTGTLTNLIGGALEVYGSVTLAAGMTFSFSGVLTINAPGSTFTSNGKTLLGTLIVVAGGELTLIDDLVCSVALQADGSLDANDRNVTCARFVSSNANARMIAMGSGLWMLTGGGATVWDMSTTTGLTLNAETSTIKLTDASAGIKTFSGGGQVFNDIWLTGAGTGSFDFVGSNTFNNFQCDTPPHTIRFTAGSITTVGSWDVNGTLDDPMTIESITAASHALVKSGGGVAEGIYLSIAHSDASPAATWIAIDSTDVGNNTGWAFNPSVYDPTPTEMDFEAVLTPDLRMDLDP